MENMSIHSLPSSSLVTHLSLKLCFIRRANIMHVRHNATLMKQSFADSGVTKLELGNEGA